VFSRLPKDKLVVPHSKVKNVAGGIDAAERIHPNVPLY